MQLGINKKLSGRVSLVSLKWLFVTLAITILLSGIAWVVRAWTIKFNHLIDLGWGAYVGWPEGNLFVFISACIRDATCQPILARAWQQVQREFPWLLLGIAFIISAVGAAITASLGSSEIEKPPGGARWATKTDLRPLLHGEKGNPQLGYLGLHPNGHLLRLPERLRCAHTLIIGGTGAGKSTGYYKPNLLMDALDGCSAVVIDLKFPDVKSGLFGMVPSFAERHDVQLFLPFNDTSLRLPLLVGAEDAITASQITDILTPLSDRGGDGGFFSKQQRALLTGLIMGFARTGSYSLAALVKLLLSGTQEVEAYVRHHLDEDVRERLAGFFEQDKRIRNGVVRGLVEDLEPFTDPRLERSTTPSENAYENIDLSTIGTRPTLLYIGIPQDELMRTRGQALLQLIKRLLDRTLIQTANAYEGQLPVHTSIYLDEFTSLGELPNIGEGFATMRSRRVAYHISLQNRAQGEALYGPTAFRSFISGNVRQTLIFPRSLSFEDAAYFSEVMGDMTATAHTTGTSYKHIFEWPNRLRRQQEVARPLLSVQEMQDWSEGTAILLQGGSPPSRVLLPRLDKRRFLGIRNPLFSAYQEHVAKDIQVAQMVESILSHRKKNVVNNASHRLEALKGQYALNSSQDVKAGEIDLSPIEDKHITNDNTQQNSDVPTIPTHEALKRWLETVLERQIPVQIETAPHNNDIVCLIVSRTALPEGLEPESLKVWLSRGWVAQTRETIAIFGEGLTLIGDGTLKRLRALQKRKQRKATHSERIRVQSSSEPLEKSKVSERLRTWIKANGRYLDGHPDYEALTEEEKETSDMLGWHQPRSLKLPNVALKKIIGDVPDTFRGIRINNRQGSEIQVQDLEHFPKLATWCREHIHLFKGHPSFEAELEPVGTYHEESLGLPKREYQRILGRVPKGAKQRDLTIGHGSQRRKRRLQTYTFAEEAF